MEHQEGSISVEEAKQLIKDRDLVQKLVNSRGWKRVIEKRYYEEEALRMVDARCNFAMTLDQRKNLDTMLAAIPVLKGFIRKVVGEGNQAEIDLEEYDKNVADQMLEGED